MASAFETWLRRWYQDRGYHVLTKGWPDLLCFKGTADEPHNVFAVEAKAGNDTLWHHQEVVHAVLNYHGLKTKVIWDHGVQGDFELQRLLKEQEARPRKVRS